MAARTLPEPGTPDGPCAAPCEHPDCALAHEMATRICRLCQEPLGYGRPFYADPADFTKRESDRSLVHASCLQDALERGSF